jgi:hypothetical protein
MSRQQGEGEIRPGACFSHYGGDENESCGSCFIAVECQRETDKRLKQEVRQKSETGEEPHERVLSRLASKMELSRKFSRKNEVSGEDINVYDFVADDDVICRVHIIQGNKGKVLIQRVTDPADDEITPDNAVFPVKLLETMEDANELVERAMAILFS